MPAPTDPDPPGGGEERGGGGGGAGEGGAGEGDEAGGGGGGGAGEEDEGGGASLASSLDHLLATWLFVGSILAWLSLHALEALGPSLPTSSHLAAYGIGAVAISVLWIAGFRPPVRDAGVFFLATIGSYALSLPTLGRILFAWPPLADWQALVLLGLATLLGTTVAFTGPGNAVRSRLRRRVMKVLLPQRVDRTGSE